MRSAGYDYVVVAGAPGESNGSHYHLYYPARLFMPSEKTPMRSLDENTCPLKLALTHAI